MVRFVFWMVGLVAVGAAGCAHGNRSFPPLYPGPERAATEVASLSGPVEKVDGVDVSHLGSGFLLLPGCHVVELPASIGEGGVGGAWSADIRARVYVIDMKPGHSYKISVRLLPGNHSVGTANVGGVEIKATEADGQGNRVRTWQPTRRRQEIEACRASAVAEEESEASAEPKAPAETAIPAEPATPAVPAAAPAPVTPVEPSAEESK